MWLRSYSNHSVSLTTVNSPVKSLKLLISVLDKVEEHLHMSSQTMVNKIHMTSSQAMINIKALTMSSQIMISSMIPIIKTSSPTIHKGRITATTHKVRYADLFFFLVVFSFFLKYKFIYFNWRLITLQYCIDFAIHQHESATLIFF